MSPIGHIINLPLLFPTQRASYSIEIDGINQAHNRILRRLSRKVASGVLLMMDYTFKSKPWLKYPEDRWVLDWGVIYAKWDFDRLKKPFQRSNYAEL